MLLGALTQKLHDHGNRAVAHGTCPQVGIGGHATIGGLGPASRMWGSLLDHIQEVEVVLANASVIRASNLNHPDLFFAVKGAAAGFGIVTKFVLRTQPDPGEIIDYTFTYKAPSQKALAQTFKDWQRFISDPRLTWKLSSQATIYQGGMTITGEYFGPRAEFDSLDLTRRLASSVAPTILTFNNYLELVVHWAEQLALSGGIRTAFASKNFAYSPSQLIPASGIDNLFEFLDIPNKGAAIWFLIFDLEAGATNTIPTNATAYSHRDALFYSQSYAVNYPKVVNDTFNFVSGINNILSTSMQSNSFLGSYPGYVDPSLSNPQKAYWGSNLPKLEQIKRVYDPKDVFWNPQSVRPAKKEAARPCSSRSPISSSSRPHSTIPPSYQAPAPSARQSSSRAHVPAPAPSYIMVSVPKSGATPSRGGSLAPSPTY